MNGILAAALPVFGLLACLFVGFILLSSESRSGERFAYVFFGVGVAWLLASGTVLWPKVSHAGPAPMAQAASVVKPAPVMRAMPPYAYGGYAPRYYAYGPYRYAYPPQPGYPPYGYYR
jgi:hypothetical protein